jgi:hypothetical protein
LIFRLLACDGVSGREDTDVLRRLERCCRCGVGSPFRAAAAGPLSADWDRLGFAAAMAADSFLIDWGSEAKEAKCWDKMDRFSSIGVKMLCDLRWDIFLIAVSVLMRGAFGFSGASALGSTGGGGWGSR